MGPLGAAGSGKSTWAETRYRARRAAYLAVARSAGLSLMDHLVQIPQVGRAWNPIAEPWVSAMFLALPDLTGADDLDRCAALTR